MGTVLLVSLAVLLILNIPIGIVLGLSSLIALAVSQKVPLYLVAQRMFTGLDSFPLMAIPLFMIAGKFMERGGISKRLVDLASNIVGSIAGGLGLVAIMGCMFFAAISGSAPATVVAIGSIAVPAMLEAGYDKDFSVALMAAAGTIGVIIPPSIPFVTYGITMNASIGQLFVAGIIPGIIMGGSLMLLCYIIAKKRGYRGTVKPSLRGFLTSLRDSLWGLMMPVIILGGIYGGVFTPTEAAAVACVYAFFVGTVVYKELSFRDFIKGFSEAGVTSAMVLFILATATAMGWIMTTEQIPVKVANYLSSVSNSTQVLLLLINVILLITGCLMELNAAIMILGPIFLPLIMNTDINLIHFGVIMVVNMTLGLLTPPLGIHLFVAGTLTEGVTFKQIVRAVMPFLIILLVDLMLFTYIPQLSLVLMNLLGVK